VAVAGKDTTEVMGAAGRLHPDNASRQLLRQPDQRLAFHPAPDHNRAGRVKPNHAADVLAEVDAKHRDIHPFLLLIRRRAYDAGRRAAHSINSNFRGDHNPEDRWQARWKFL
jgi:hypothetical protein